jgi:prepilin-type N-terminal cleavage/methylation domain-containing protein
VSSRSRLGVVLADVASDNSGFTLIEVLVAAVILVIGATAVLMTLVAGIHNVQRGKDTQIAIDVAQREIEKVRSLPFDEVALAAAPTVSAVEGNPDYRVSGTSFYLKRNRTELTPLCIAGKGECVGQTGRVVTGPSQSCVGGTAGGSFSVGGTSGQVYCFVAVQHDKSCEETTKAVCIVKRVVVDVWLAKLANTNYQAAYYELQAGFVDTEPGG